MRFLKFFFENYADAPWNETNPRYTLFRDGADEVVAQVAEREPFSLTSEDCSDSGMAAMLAGIGVLRVRGGRLALDSPVFLEADLPLLQDFGQTAAERICGSMARQRRTLEEIAGTVRNGASVETNLYHLLCGRVFDGLVFDDLAEAGLAAVSRAHASGLDYLAVLYEDCPALNGYSRGLLCSYNRMSARGGVFSSFGDSDGERKTPYRYRRLFEAGRLAGPERRYGDFDADALAGAMNDLIDGKPIPREQEDILEFFGYTRAGSLSVPTYGPDAAETARTLYATLRPAVWPVLEETLEAVVKSRAFTASKHGVEGREIANEVYHIVFGEVNERLAALGWVEKPPRRTGEGRYLSCYERSKE